ncbi:MAG: pilus assembly protein PilM, partial [Pseudomonadota bacterium]|nr:pilus assembly protein PilM [Pseudomonadota bacterium]
MGIFSPKRLKAVAVDIGTSSVKVLELDRRGSSYRVGQFAIEPLPRNAVVERGISDVEAVSGAVRQAIKRSKCKRKPAIVAIASSHVVSRTVQIPVGLRES